MDVLKLPTDVRNNYMECENRINEKYLEIVRNLAIDELAKFNKFKYRDQMYDELRECVDKSIPDETIKTECHYMSNALNNESQNQLGRKRRQENIETDISPRKTRRQTAVNTANKSSSTDAKSVSDSFSELFITQNEPEIETLNQSAQDECNDSITVAKTVANSDALETIKNSDSDVLNSSNITGQGQTVVDNPKGQKGKKGRKSKKKSSTDTNITLCICNDSQMVSDMIRCNFCQIWFHTRCITDDCDNETGFRVCSECRLLSTRIKNIESVLLSFVGQYEEVQTKLAQKSAELVHSQEENSRLRDRLKKGAQNSQPEAVNTHPPNTELEEEKKRRGTLLVGSSVIREITKYTFDCDTDPICVRGGRVSDITAKLLSSSNDEPDQNIIL